MIVVTPMAPAVESDRVILRAAVAGHSRGNMVEMRFPMAAEAVISADRSDAWLLAMLIPAMEEGAALHIAGAVSERLLYSVNKSIIPLLMMYRAHWKQIAVTANSSAEPIDQSMKRGVGTGFSGGVDSLITLKEYTAAATPSSLKVSVLFFNSVGQFGADSHWFETDLELARRGAQKFGLDIVDVETNLDSFFQSNFTDSHTIRNLSVPLALQAGLKSFLYSAGLRYDDTTFSKDDIAYLDPILVPLLSTESLTFFSVGAEYSRTHKTRILTGIQESFTSLYVCLRGNTKRTTQNCSVCSKCSRTIVTLDLLGSLDSYGTVFDLNILKDRRAAYIRALSSASPTALSDILKLSKRENRKIPISWFIAAAAIRVFRTKSPGWLRWRLFKWFPKLVVR